jgi:hypothetical protein
MAVVRTIYPVSVAWNGNTWNKDTGGLLKVDFQHTSQPVEDRTGGDEYPVAIYLVNKGLTVSVTLREFCMDLGASMDCGTSGNLVVTLETCTATDVCTFANMMLTDVSASQDHGILSESVLTFIHLSTNGTTDPVS